MGRFIAALVCHQCSDDSRIFVGQGHDGLLSSIALPQRYGPAMCASSDPVAGMQAAHKVFGGK